MSLLQKHISFLNHYIISKGIKVLGISTRKQSLRTEFTDISNYLSIKTMMPSSESTSTLLHAVEVRRSKAHHNNYHENNI